LKGSVGPAGVSLFSGGALVTACAEGVDAGDAGDPGSWGAVLGMAGGSVLESAVSSGGEDGGVTGVISAREVGGAWDSASGRGASSDSGDSGVSGSGSGVSG